MNPLLSIKGLQVDFQSSGSRIRAVDDVDLTVNEGEVVGLVGESGSGKSVTALSVMGLVPQPPGKIVNGLLTFQGKDLRGLNSKQWRSLRGNEMAMIFQDPMTSLNPLYSIGNQLSEVIKQHQSLRAQVIRDQMLHILNEVGITRKEVLNEYPHQLSGGMRQRVMIAMAMVLQPKLLIADEPTTALDVTIQAQILALMRRFNQDFGTSILMVTHDLGVVAQICDRVIVMYAGQVMEVGSSEQLLTHPKHPYTEGLLKSIPRLEGNKRRLYSIPGQLPDGQERQNGCRFASRCNHRQEICFQKQPPLFPIEHQHHSRCWMDDPEGSDPEWHGLK